MLSRFTISRVGTSRLHVIRRCPSAVGVEPSRSYAKKRGATKQSSRRSIGEGEEEIVDLQKLRSSMDAAVNALKWEYTHSLITRFTPALLERVSVEVEGRNVPLKEVAQVGMPNPQNLVVNLSGCPQVVDSAVKAIRELGLNLNPVADKMLVRVPVPKMSKEQRASLVKLAKSHAEKTKVGIRRVRQKGVSDSRKKKSDVSDDALHRIEKYIQQVTEEYTDSVDELLKAKSADLMRP